MSKLEPLHGLVRSDRRVPLSRLSCSKTMGTKLPRRQHLGELYSINEAIPIYDSYLQRSSSWHSVFLLKIWV